ncbi:MAG: flagellar hook-basal body complex protein, partial [Bacillota bacterium]|nr:flagellar hook-basal body complex protein [Bacillota bacterium]
RDMFYQTLSGSSGSGTAGGSNPAQVGYGASVASVDVKNSQSGMAPTGQSSDLYINGEGYFAVKDGDSYLYTRVGSMSFDDKGYLVDGNKRFVCGANGTGDIPAAPVQIKIDDGDLGKLHDITFNADGSITGVGTDGTVKAIGKIAIANIPNPQGLTQVGGSYYRAVSNTGAVTYAAPGNNGAGGLVSSALETSNVDLSSEFAQMIVTQRGFQANSKIITVSDEMLETLVNMKR